jgi:hypothetical protein
MREALVVIPSHAAVSTTNYYGSHLSQRPTLRVMIDPRDLSPFADVEFALFNTIDHRNWACHDYRNALEEAARLGYGLQFYQDHAVVIQRHGGDPQQLQMLITTMCEASSWPISDLERQRQSLSRRTHAVPPMSRMDGAMHYADNC